LGGYFFFSMSRRARFRISPAEFLGSSFKRPMDLGALKRGIFFGRAANRGPAAFFMDGFATSLNSRKGCNSGGALFRFRPQSMRSSRPSGTEQWPADSTRDTYSKDSWDRKGPGNEKRLDSLSLLLHLYQRINSLYVFHAFDQIPVMARSAGSFNGRFDVVNIGSGDRDAPLSLLKAEIFLLKFGKGLATNGRSPNSSPRFSVWAVCPDGRTSFSEVRLRESGFYFIARNLAGGMYPPGTTSFFSLMIKETLPFCWNCIMFTRNIPGYIL
jgi:hypothetical protein